MSNIDWSPLFISLQTAVVTIIIVFVLGVLAAWRVVRIKNEALKDWNRAKDNYEKEGATPAILDTISTNTIDTTDLNSNSVLPFSHNSNSLNNIKINSSVIIKTNNNSYNASEILKNSSISDLMNKTMYNNEKNINSLNFSNDNILIDNLTIKDIMNNLFKDDGVINLSSTINYIDHIINYDIVQMRITYKTVKEYLININVNNVNISAVDKDLKPFMLGLRNKAGKLTVLAIFINARLDSVKSYINL